MVRHNSFSCFIIVYFCTIVVTGQCLLCSMFFFQVSSYYFIGFVDGVICHTCNLVSTYQAIYGPIGQLVALGGACLGPMTNNVDEYNVVIELLWDCISRGITILEVRLESQLVFARLNGDYQERRPTLLHQFLKVRFLERIFEHISYSHISRNQNTITDAFANDILDWHLSHTL